MRKRLIHSLRFHLILIVAFSIVPMLGLLLHLSMKERTRGIFQTQATAQDLAQTIGRFQKLLIGYVHPTLRPLSYLPWLQMRDSESISQVFSRIMSKSPEYTELAAALPDGEIFASWPKTTGKVSFADLDCYKRLMMNYRVQVSGYTVGRIAKRAEILMAYPVLDSAGRHTSILFAGLNTDYLNRYLAGNLYPPGATVRVLDSAGIILARYPYAKRFIGKRLKETSVLDAMHQRRTGALAYGTDGAARVYGFTTVGQGADAQHVVVAIPQSVAYAAAKQDLVENLMILLLVTLLALLGAWLVGDLCILRKVGTLLATMKKVTGGNFSIRTGVTRADGELNQLAHAFDRMAENLELWQREAMQQADTKLQMTESRIQLIIKEMPIACVVWDPGQHVTLWNAAAERVFGFTEAEILGKHPYDFITVKEARADVDRVWSKLIAGSSTSNNVRENRTKAGYKILCEWNSTPLKDERGSVVAVVSMAHDITERKKAEAALLNLTRTLKMLSGCNQVLVRAQSESELLEKICRLIVERGKYRMAWVGYAEPDAGKTIRPVSRWGYDEGYLEGLSLTGSDAAASRGPAWTAIRSVMPAIVKDIQTDPDFVTKEEALKRGYASCIVLPLFADGNAFGVLVIYSEEKDAFDMAESRLLEELADDLAYGIRSIRIRTEHRLATEALQESEKRFRNLYEDAPIAYHALDKDGKILAVNRKWLEMFGFAKDEVLGKSIRDFLSFPYVDGFIDRFQQNNETNRVTGIITEFLKKDGRHVVVELERSIKRDEFGQFKECHSTVRDVTDIRETESAIQALVENSMSITGNDYFDEVVGKLCEWLGVEVAVVGELFDESHIRILSMKVDGVLSHGSEYCIDSTSFKTVCDKGYSIYPENVQALFPQEENLAILGAAGYMGIPLKDREGRCMGILAAISRRKINPPKRAEDVMNILAARAAAELNRVKMEAERDRMERQLLQAQKMEAVGTLAGGIAHDFNNILGIIFGYSEMTQLEMPKGTRADSYIENVIEAATRARELVQQILAFSRQSDRQLRPLSLRPIIKEGLKLLRAALPATIQIRQHIEPGDDTILGDPTQIHQVLMNLCTNAGQAMGAEGGILEVNLSVVHFEREDTQRPRALEPGRYVQLTVRDTGPGMTPAVMERIWEPYFTTKKQGEGTGLGLSVVHGVITQYGGAVTVDSRPGAGVTFRVFFPKLEGEELPVRKEERPLPRGSETILLVDDEPLLLDAALRGLEYLGYKVISCTNGTEALETFREKPERFDLVITDQTMPLMTGTALAKNILAIRDEMPIILSTGFNKGYTHEKMRSLGIREILSKPLALSHMAVTVRRVLDKDRGD